MGALQNLIDEIKLKTDTIGATAMTVAQPVAANGDVTIFVGDAYTTTHGVPIDFTNIRANPDLTASSVALVVFDGRTTVLTVTGTVTSSGGLVQSVRFQPTAAQTATLTRTGTGSYRHQIQAVWAADNPAQPKVVAQGAVNTARRF